MKQVNGWLAPVQVSLLLKVTHVRKAVYVSKAAHVLKAVLGCHTAHADTLLTGV